jgi:ATP-dependent helicase/nuclease subunit A
MAGAGTGKTTTLVERCLDCLLNEEPRVSLEEILMVTFTEAAAADMRRRIRERLEQELNESSKPQAQPSSKAPDSNPKNREDRTGYLREQLALFETAHIGTLHSFCFQLVRQHFYELGLDPQITVMAEEEDQLLAHETLDEMLQAHYAGGTKAAEAVQELIEVQGNGRDQSIRTLVLRLHHYTQTRPDPAGWLGGELERLANNLPLVWEHWLAVGFAEWVERSLEMLGHCAPDNAVARDCRAILGSVPSAESAAALKTICEARNHIPYGKKTAWGKPLKHFFEEADFLSSLMAGKKEEGEISPLAEDWNWVRGHMTTLLELAREFEANFSEAKRELGVVDFHDLEQHTLRLLWDAQTSQPTPIAQRWRQQFRFVFVDEYQDINAAQDKIIEALSREKPEANRFLVGDVKQSIYRFRLANPAIFQNYARLWGMPGRIPESQVIPLVENFRSREGLLNFVNSLFRTIMRQEVGGVDYDEQAKLQFGAAAERQKLGTIADPAPRVELCLRLKIGKVPRGNDGEDNSLTELADLDDADKEARAVALRLRELKSQQHSVWDEASKQFRPMEWSDVAILLRSPANKSERYAKAFAHLDVPLQVARGGFYESLEISDLLSLLRALDNPLQDLPLLAVLRSPLVGLTLNELAEVRLAAKGPFWTAVGEKAEGERLKAQREGPDSEGPLHEPEVGHLLSGKIQVFLERFNRWRRMARRASLSHCLETVLDETHYASWLRSQPGGEQRYANVQRLLGLAREFDQLQRQGLSRFLRFVEAQQEAGGEPQSAPVSEENAVRLMSIHQSKGLEFPVVVVADLGKPFNVADLRAELILDEKYGLCPQVAAPNTGTRYPSLPHWLASRRQHVEMLGEELRLLYVAMTRARDTLLLSASITESRFEKVWKGEADANQIEPDRANSFADWLGMWFYRNCATNGAQDIQSGNALLRWAICEDSSLIGQAEIKSEQGAEPASLEPAAWQQLQEQLGWRYPFESTTGQAAKIRVSEFARRAAERPDEEALEVGGRKGVGKLVEKTSKGAARRHGGGLSAAEIGSIHHLFLESVSLDRTGSVEKLRAEASRLEQLGVLTEEQSAAVDLEGVAAFWNSKLGLDIRAQEKHVRRELAFTVRFALEELEMLLGEGSDRRLEPVALAQASVERKSEPPYVGCYEKPERSEQSSELIVAEGKADLAVILPNEIWLVDFKTDRVKESELAERAKLYSVQLSLYARALAEIYRRPVTQSWVYFLAAREAVRL